MVLENAAPRTEIQLLRYRHPQALPDPDIGDLHKLGFNHVCFAVDDIEAEYARLRARGVSFRKPPTDVGSTKIAVFDDTCGNLIQIAAEKK